MTAPVYVVACDRCAWSASSATRPGAALLAAHHTETNPGHWAEVKRT
jgi:hypothetical protein